MSFSVHLLVIKIELGERYRKLDSLGVVSTWPDSLCYAPNVQMEKQELLS